MLDFDLQNDLGLCMNHAVLDIDNGTILKLGENHEVLAAVKGRNFIDVDKMEKFDMIKWPAIRSMPHEQVFG